MKEILLAVLLFSSQLSAQTYKNLVFEGGGIRGIAYAGALSVLEEEHGTDSICRIAGTSVGAVAGALYAVGYDAGELKALMGGLKIQTFNDGRWFFIGGFHRMGRYYGWYRGEALEHWIGKLLAAKTGDEHISFRQLHELSLKNRRFKDMYITATNLSLQKATVFSYKTFPDMEIRTAVRASISIPLYFSAVILDERGRKITRPGTDVHYDVYVDGGVLANYPISMFDSDGPDQTLGLKLERPEQLDYYNQSKDIAPYTISNFRSYVGALYNVIIENLNRDSSTRPETSRTIYISTGNISPKVRKISKAQKEVLYMNGVNAAKAFTARKPG